MSGDGENAEAGTNSDNKPSKDPPNVNPVNLDFGDWKDALAEFVDRQDGADEDDQSDKDDCGR